MFLVFCFFFKVNRNKWYNEDMDILIYRGKNSEEFWGFFWIKWVLEMELGKKVIFWKGWKCEMVIVGSEVSFLMIVFWSFGYKINYGIKYIDESKNI